MKFSDLKVGENFEYQGSRLRKTSPLMASALDTGRQQLIRRSSDVRRLDQRDSPDPLQNQPLERALVREALVQYQSALTSILAQHPPGAEAQDKIETLRRNLYKRLGIE